MIDDGTDDYKIIMLNKRCLNFRVIKVSCKYLRVGFDFISSFGGILNVLNFKKGFALGFRGFYLKRETFVALYFKKIQSLYVRGQFLSSGPA